MSLHNFFKNEDETPLIDLSSLIDMMFILLLFFIVTTTFDRNDAIQIQKAQAKSAKPVEEDRFKIMIDSSGLLYIGEKALPIQTVLAEVKPWYTEHPNGAILILPDKKSPMEPFIQLMDELKQAGVQNIALGAEASLPSKASP